MMSAKERVPERLQDTGALLALAFAVAVFVWAPKRLLSYEFPRVSVESWAPISAPTAA